MWPYDTNTHNIYMHTYIEISVYIKKAIRR